MKKGRITDDSAGAGSSSPSMPTTPTPARHVPTSTLDQRTPIAPIQLTTPPPPCAWNHCRKKVADGVRSLMTDVHHLATRKPANGQPRLFEEIHQLRALANDLERNFYPSHILEYIKDPTTDTLPTPPAPVEAATAKPTYATAAKAATPATVPKGPSTKKPPQKPRRLDKVPTPPTTFRSAPQRLILRFANSSVIKSLSDPQRLRDTLNTSLNGAVKLRGVNRSRGGNLVLHTQAPYTAVQLREHEQTIWSVVRSYFSLLDRDRPRFNLDKPWQRVVIHHVPVTTDPSYRSIAEELRWSNEAIGSLGDVMGIPKFAICVRWKG
ncbi:hypothetical protein R3P38DRAFT_3184450 [Favolaschia claudopus]|uniref:Uncharacterized protein n=1 Tax=Favolaschia claudopus TaxID=2862362 RepID=A0AAW0C8J6_9AGAR